MYPMPTAFDHIAHLVAHVHAYVQTRNVRALLRSWLIITTLVVAGTIRAIPDAEVSVVISGVSMPEWQIWGVILMLDGYLSFVLAAGFLWLVSLMTGDAEYAGPVLEDGEGV